MFFVAFSLTHLTKVEQFALEVTSEPFALTALILGLTLNLEHNKTASIDDHLKTWTII